MSADDHGYYSTYTNYSCRCDPCRAANTAAVRRQREARAAKPMPTTVLHGSNATYNNWGCRCDPCTAAHAAAAIRQYRARRAS